MSHFTRRRPRAAGWALLAGIVLLLALLLCGCTPGDEAGGDQLQIVTTIFPPYDFARQLGGEHVTVTMLAAPGSEAHDFVPSLTDVDAIARCDLFLYIGGDIDGWAEQTLSSLGERAPRALRLMDLVETLMEEPHDHGEEEAHEDHDELVDEHIWTSPRNAMRLCQGIAAALEELDPAHAAAYADALTAYLAQLAQLDEALQQVVAESVRQTVVFADRFPFRYLADELGLTCYAAFDGCSSDTEPSLASIAQLTQTIQSERVPVVFYLEFSDQTVADTLCAATGAEKRLLHSCHNVTQAQWEAGVSYLELMQQNVEALSAALSG